MWVGREKEIAELRCFVASGNMKASLMYGKRRIGKTTLVKKVLDESGANYIFFEALESDYQKNLDSLTALFAEKLSMQLGSYRSFLDAFSILKVVSEPLIIVIDEYQYLKQSRPKGEVDSEFKQVIDNLPEKTKLVLTGSYVTIMKELLEEDNPLFGRFSLVQNLKELDYVRCRRFYQHRSISEAVGIHAVFGGSPYILGAYDESRNLEENIKALLLNDTGTARTYIEFLLFKEVGKVGVLNDILNAIGNGKLRYSEIESRLNMKSTGLLATYLELLKNMELIECIAPINNKSDKKKRFYAIKDNLVRFYYAYVYSNKSALQNIGEDLFYESYVRPSLDTFISYRFEAMARSYLMRRETAEKSTSVLDIGTYWYDDAQTKSNGEFDCVIRFKDHYAVYEVKHYSTPMTLAEIEAEADKIRRIRELSPVEIGFVCSSGFESRPEGYDYITADDMYAV